MPRRTLQPLWLQRERQGPHSSEPWSPSAQTTKRQRPMRPGRASAPRSSAHLKWMENRERKMERAHRGPVAQAVQHPIAKGFFCGNYIMILTVALNNFSCIHEAADGKAFRMLSRIDSTAGRNINPFLSDGGISRNLRFMYAQINSIKLSSGWQEGSRMRWHPAPRRMCWICGT